MKRKSASKKSTKHASRKRWWRRWQPLLIVLLVTLPALVIAPDAKENFRLPKLLLSEWLVLFALFLLCFRLRSVERIDLRSLPRHPVLVAVLPLLLAAAIGLVTSEHPLHVRQGLLSLGVAVAALWGFSLALRGDEHRRILTALTVPATLLSLIAIGQYHQLYELFRFREFVKERIGVTSLAGGAFDLGGFLVLPALLAQLKLWQGSGRQRWGWGLALALYLYTLAVTQTLTAIVALAAASFVLWLWLLPWRRLVAATALLAIVGVGIGWGVAPLRERIERKLGGLKGGNVNRVLTGRLDGWRAAGWMIDREPLLGVGHGAYRAEFGRAKLALREEGRGFYRQQHQTYFSNAHNDFLEAVAEWGIVGALALLWGVGCLVARLRARQRAITAAESDAPEAQGAGVGDAVSRTEVALMSAGVVALGVMALNSFPLRIALVAYPYVVLLAWIFARGPEHDRDDAGPAVSGRRLLWLVAPALLLALFLHGRQATERLRASQQLASVEQGTRSLARQGVLTRRPLDPRVRRLLEQGASMLRDASELDPVEVGIPIARGSLYYLLGRPAAAIRIYEDALKLEARAEIYTNLGRAHLQQDDPEAAREAFRKAVLLNHNLAKDLRPYLQDDEARSPDRSDESTGSASGETGDDG